MQSLTSKRLLKKPLYRLAAEREQKNPYLSEMGTHLLAFLNTEHSYIISVVRLL